MTKEPSEAAMRAAFRTLFADEHEIPGAHDHPCLCTPVQLARALDRHAAAERERIARQFQDEGHRPIYTDGAAIAAAIRSAPND